MADDLTRRAIIAAHVAEIIGDRHCEAVHTPSLSKREAAIVEAWRADREEAADSPQRLFGRLISTAKGRQILDENGIHGTERANKAEAAIQRARTVLDDLDASHRRAVSDRAITDDYTRGRVHAEDDLWRRLGAALDERDADA